MGIAEKLFGIALGSAHIAGHAVKGRLADARRNVQYQETCKRNNKFLRPELEKKYTEMIEDPERFDEVWDILEKHKWLFSESIELDKKKYGIGYEWDFVDGTRKPFHGERGSLEGNTSRETKQLQYNRDLVLFLLMDTNCVLPKRIIDDANENNEDVCFKFKPRK